MYKLSHLPTIRGPVLAVSDGMKSCDWNEMEASSAADF